MHLLRWSGAKVSVNVVGLAVMAVLVGLWQLVVGTGVVHFRYLPAPSAIVSQAGELFSSTHLGTNAIHTVEVTLISWAVASIAGVILGLALGMSRTAWSWSAATIDILRALPAIAFVPVAVLIWGLSTKMELVISMYVAFWPVVIYSIDGVQNVAPLMSDVAKTLGLSRRQMTLKIRLPSAIGPIIVGLRLALTLSLVLAVVAEMIGNTVGLGYQLVFEQNALKPALMFGYMLIIGIIGLVFNGGFRWLLKTFAPNLTSGPETLR